MIERNVRHRLADRGQASVLSIAVIVVLVAIALAFIELGVVGVQRGRVQAIADLTALAATHGDVEGATTASRNDAVIVRVMHDTDGSVTVVVERDGHRATASATSSP